MGSSSSRAEGDDAGPRPPNPYYLDGRPGLGGRFLTPQQLQAMMMDAPAMMGVAGRGMRAPFGMGGDGGGGRAAAPPEMQHTYTIRNDVNLKKGSLKLVPREGAEGRYDLSFVLDTACDALVTIRYVGTEVTDDNGLTLSFDSEEELTRIAVPKALDGRFSTLDHDFALNTADYSAEQLVHRRGSSNFPIIVVLETDDGGDESSVQSQTTFITLSASSEGVYSAKVLKQKIQVAGQSYELQEIFGLDAADGDGSLECVVCMTEPRDTTVLPCRHMCLCSSCAQALRLQSDTCPICRSHVDSLLQIRVGEEDGDEAEGAAGAEGEEAKDASGDVATVAIMSGSGGGGGGGSGGSPLHTTVDIGAADGAADDDDDDDDDEEEELVISSRRTAGL